MPTCCTFVLHQLEKLDKPPFFPPCLRLIYPCWQSPNRLPVPWRVNLVLKEKKATGGHRNPWQLVLHIARDLFHACRAPDVNWHVQIWVRREKCYSLGCCLPSLDLTDYTKATDAHQATFTNTCAETQHETTSWQTNSMLLWKTGPYQFYQIGS